VFLSGSGLAQAIVERLLVQHAEHRRFLSSGDRTLDYTIAAVDSSNWAKMQAYTVLARPVSVGTTQGGQRPLKCQ
jgi:hypothetical protein